MQGRFRTGCTSLRAYGFEAEGAGLGQSAQSRPAVTALAVSIEIVRRQLGFFGQAPLSSVKWANDVLG
jgi:hypothetical protein